MIEDNKKFIDPNDFYERVLCVMEQKNITLEKLHNTLNEDIGYQITRNNLSIYIQRLPNINFMIALCKALGVSSDCLLGLNDSELYNKGFDYNYSDKRYEKYIYNDYNFYFYPTVSSSPSKIHSAKLSIEFDSFFKVKLTIITSEEERKEYIGKLILSKTYDIGYITLKNIDFGEMVYLSFHDPVINGNNVKTEILHGAMLSVSSGDLIRMPVMSKFVLSRKKIPDELQDILIANLKMNSKYIEIEEEDFKRVIDNLPFDKELKQKIFQRLTAAFSKEEYYTFEEGYICNTLSKDFRISSLDSIKLINSLRSYSLANPNCKINNKIDTKLFEYLNSNSR